MFYSKSVINAGKNRKLKIVSICTVSWRVSRDFLLFLRRFLLRKFVVDKKFKIYLSKRQILLKSKLQVVVKYMDIFGNIENCSCNIQYKIPRAKNR